MKHVLVSSNETLKSRWSSAFLQGQCVATLKQAVRVPKKDDPLYWLDIAGLDDSAAIVALDALSVRSKVVVLSPMPSKTESSAMIRAGASGLLPLGYASGST